MRMSPPGLAKAARKAVRQGRKSNLPVRHVPSAEEEVRILKRRIEKAERDERMDITLALTPPRCWLGGFTRPRDLRAANWFPGGPYLAKNKQYESPPQSAYEPHTVFLLESRYRVRHGTGRADAKDHIVGTCRAGDFVRLVERYNSAACPGTTKDSMDNACWPWLPGSGKELRPTRWWGEGERPEDIMRDIYEDEEYDYAEVQRVASEAEEELEEGEDSNKNQKKKPRFIPLEWSASDVPQQTEATVAAPASAKTTFDANYIRKLYEVRLADEPFWLPLLAITFSTRPLALTVERLSKGRERGTPFGAVMANDDRRCLYSVSNRMTSMRLDRMRQLTLDVVSRLSGHKGGFVGIRFTTGQRGRGIGGEGLADPIPPDKRIVKVQVGRWFYRSLDEAELYREEAEAWGGADALDLAMMNEMGRRLDKDGNEVPLIEAEASTDKIQEMDVDEEADLDPEAGEESQEDDAESLLNSPHLPGVRKRWKFKPALQGDDEAAAALRKKLAYKLAAGHRTVVRV